MGDAHSSVFTIESIDFACTKLPSAVGGRAVAPYSHSIVLGGFELMS
jgi:hypothetical protein